MQNRFGVKDFILFLLIGVVIVLVVLSMVQVDRQWEQIQLTKNQLQEQTRDLARVRRLLEQGVAVAPPANGGTSIAAASSSTQPVGVTSTAVSANDRVRAAQQLPGYATGDFYIDMLAAPPEKLTPIVSSDVYASNIQSYVLEPLARRDPQTLQWAPVIAQSWTVSPDGMTAEFTLKRGVTFSDGEPVTADDVVFSYRLIMNEKIEAPRQRVYYEKIKSCEKLNDHAVRFTFGENYFKNFESVAGLDVLPEHFYGKFSPEEFNRSTGLLMGSGQYRMPDPAGWRNEPGKPVEIVRNERYWGEPAPFNKIVWRVVQNESARMTTFLNGDADEFGPSPEQYKKMLADEALLKRTKHFEFDNPTGGYIYIGWNQRRNDRPTIFADKRVRQAMTMLIDRQAICEQIMLGYASVASGPFSPQGKQADPSVTPWPYDPERAKRLLDDAGFRDRNGDGVLESADGKELRFKLAYPSTSETYSRVVLLVKDTLARAGIVCEPKPTEWSVLLQELERRDFDAASLGWGGTIESDLYQIFHSSQMAGTGDNNVQYSNPALDKLMERARTTVDEGERNKLWQEAHRVLHEDQPYTFVMNRKSLVFIDGRFENVQRVTLGLNPITEWFVPTEKRKWEK